MVERLKTSVLESMIDQKIILKKAEMDSVFVDEKEVELSLDQQIQMLVSQAGGEKKAEEALGQSIKSFRREFWYEMRDRLVSEKYQQQLINSIKVTRSDVLSFYKTYRDSLPNIPLKAKIRHCLIKIKPSKSSKNTSILFLKKIKNNIEKGDSFSIMAEKHSEDPATRKNGGSLGWVKRGSLVKSFETAAFTSALNTITNPIETEFGFHLIKTLKKQGDKVLVSHILSVPKTTKEDSVKYHGFATSLMKDSIKTINDFSYFSKKYSDDKNTNVSGGLLGWIDPNNYSIPEIGLVLKHIKTGQCSGPVNSSLGYHLLWVEGFKKGGKPNLTDHWVDIENMSLNKKKMDWYENWLKKARSNIYINIKK